MLYIIICSILSYLLSCSKEKDWLLFRWYWRFYFFFFFSKIVISLLGLSLLFAFFQKDFDIFRLFLFGIFLCVFCNGYLSLLYREKNSFINFFYTFQKLISPCELFKLYELCKLYELHKLHELSKLYEWCILYELYKLNEYCMNRVKSLEISWNPLNCFKYNIFALRFCHFFVNI